MVFTEPRFLLFFAVFFLAHWTLRGERPRKWLLLGASYLFYSAWDWRFSFLLLASTLIDFIAGLKIEASQTQAGRRRWITLSLVGTLGILCFFKYYNFFTESAAALLHRIGIEASPPVLNVVLPVGVSFYTFQTLSYGIDVYRGSLKACHSLLDFSLFVAFFPQLVAGPIVRATDFLPQLDHPRRWRDVNVRWCMGLFLAGYLKKACIADHLAVQVDRVFASPGDFGCADNWLGLLAYQVQVYCDFSGYSDMALATAGLLGYQLMKNFDFPYFGASIAEFWRRWHISLSTWLRDYLYISLGGSRGSGLRSIVNIFVTFGLCGLWHGAAWNFVVFGLIHGVYVTVHSLWSRSRAETPGAKGLGFVPGIVLTNLFFALSLVVFRSTSWENCGAMFLRLFRPGADGTSHIHGGFWILLAILAVAHWISWRGYVQRVADRISNAWLAPLFGVAWAIALFLATTEYQPFVYFQF